MTGGQAQDVFHAPPTGDPVKAKQLLAAATRTAASRST